MKSKTNKNNKRYTLVLDTLDRLERGQYTGSLDIYWVGNSIDWLWKWKKITKAEMMALCDRVIAYCEGGY